MLRRFLIAAAVGLTAGVLGAPANAARPAPSPHTVTTQHFVVHYTSDTNSSDYTTFTAASDTAALFEHVYAAELALGFGAPLDDGDGKIDVYIQDPGASILGAATADNPVGPTSSGYIELGPGSLDDVTTIAHEFFHLIQFATWVPTAKTDTWLFEGSAEWMGAKIDGFQESDVGTLGPSDMPLDCRESNPSASFQVCNPSAYIEGGYSRWPFFQSLAQRFGTSFIREVLADGAAGMSATSALATAIGAHGASLADVYNDWAVQQMDGGYGVAELDAVAPTSIATVSTGIATKTGLASLHVNVDHLATRYIQLTRGDGADDHACFAATLTVTVTIPSGVTSRPFIFWNQEGGRPVALALSGATATGAIPWDTCAWPGNAAYLALPNDTTTVDTADFHVTVDLAVTDVPTSATAPPSQGSIYGGQQNVSNAEIAPTIALFGPLLLRVPASDPQLRLIVESTDVGKVHATLGSVDLGTPAVRAGNNDLRFAIPKSLLSALRRKLATGTNVLSLTPVSPSGTVTGAPVTRTVSVTAAPKKSKKHRSLR